MRKLFRFLLVPVLLATLAACNDDAWQSVADKANQPLPQDVVARMKSEDMARTSPIMMRIFKEEGVLEIWKQKRDGKYGKIAQYQICAWSGKLGPKKTEGDRQSPEGFYLIKPSQMNPDSHYYLSFNIGYPNAYDRSLGRTGSNIMIHGVCSSAGCYSMTDKNVAQIYAFARDAFQGGQRAFQVEAFPFRMTAENMARHRDNPNFGFWKMLKVGYDYFQITRTPPDVNVCDRKYVFNQQVMDNSPFVATAACPSMKTPEALQVAYNSYEKQYDKAYEQAVTQQTAEAARNAEIARRKQQAIEAEARARVNDEQRKEASRKAADHFFSSLTSFLPGSSSSGNAKADAAGAAMAEASAVPANQPAAVQSADAGAKQASTPVPTADPRTDAATRQDSAGDQQTASASHKPFWKFW